jgi:hypothetical protein
MPTEPHSRDEIRGRKATDRHSPEATPTFVEPRATRARTTFAGETCSARGTFGQGPNQIKKTGKQGRLQKSGALNKPVD